MIGEGKRMVDAKPVLRRLDRRHPVMHKDPRAELAQPLGGEQNDI